MHAPEPQGIMVGLTDFRLQGAAPELLKVLKDAVADAEKAANPAARFHQYEQAKAVIAKAEGA